MAQGRASGDRARFSIWKSAIQRLGGSKGTASPKDRQAVVRSIARVRTLGLAEADLYKGFLFYEQKEPGVGSYYQVWAAVVSTCPV